MMKIGRDRLRTDPSSVSDLGTGLESSSSNELISARLCVETPWLGPDFVSGIVSSIEPRISICLLNMNLNKGRD
jgi:hypothetical protein